MNADPRALDYVLGALSADERAAVDVTRLHDAALDRSIAALELSLAGLAEGGGVEVRPGLWDQIGEALQRELSAFAEVQLRSPADADWTPLMPGIEARTLWSERTQLLRCQPGASDSAHQQEDDEHILMIAGDLVIGGRVFSTGDHLFFAAGTRHPAMRTRSGCILLTHYC